MSGRGALFCALVTAIAGVVVLVTQLPAILAFCLFGTCGGFIALWMKARKRT